jgi:ATP-binding cassette subfamily B protein
LRGIAIAKSSATGGKGMQALGRMMRYVRPYWKQGALALVLMLGMVFVDLAIPRLVQRIIDQGVSKQDMPMIINTSLLMIGVSAIETILGIGNSLLAVRVARYYGYDLRSALFRKIQTLSFGNIDRFQTGQLMVRLTSDVVHVQMLVLFFLRVFTRAPLLAVGSVLSMISLSSDLAIVMAVLLPAAGVIIYLFATRAQPLYLTVQQRLDKLNTVLQENLSGVRVVKAFARADHESARFERANIELMGQSVQVLTLLGLLMPTMTLFINLATVAVIYVGGWHLQTHPFTTGQLLAFVNYLLQLGFPLTMMANMIGQFSAAAASAGRIEEVMNAAPDVQNRPGARPLAEASLAAEKGRVVFENVAFTYNGNGSEAVLKGVNLVAEPGQTVAILGATGSGKSTLIQLLPRFYDVTEGRITLDGVDLRELTMESLRSTIGIALQEAVLFTGTIRDNIRYGRPQASEEEVIAAAKAAQAHDFITSLPQGYDTLVGQRGVNLSGGQKQRLSIARALLVQPCLLILDDSTSSVDVETEARLEAALQTLLSSRAAGKATVFVIAQRVSTVLNADKIVVLDQGQIAAAGTHAELLANSPIYREIYDSQLGNGGLNHG